MKNSYRMGILCFLCTAILLAVIIEPCAAREGRWASRRKARREAHEAIKKNAKEARGLLTGYNVGYTVLKDTWVGKSGKKFVVDVAVWYPTTKSPEKMRYVFEKNEVATRVAVDAPARPGEYPLIAYAHGASAGGISSAFIAETLARKGYVVVGSDLSDEFSQVRVAKKVQMSFRDKLKMLRWLNSMRTVVEGTETKRYRKELAYRPGQVEASIDRMLEENSKKDSLFSGVIDEDKIGLLGHSSGAWTVMLLSGADSSYVDKRVKAAVALSGPVNEYVYHAEGPNDLAQIHIPMMFMYGEKEVAQGRGNDMKYLYKPSNPPKFLLEIKGANHFTFSGGVKKEYRTMDEYLLKNPSRRAMTKYTLSFFDYYLKGDESAKDTLLSSDSYVNIYKRDLGK